MYFSKITLRPDAGKSQAFWRIGSEYSMHQAVWDLFADQPDRKRDFLYRLDTLGKMPHIYLLSARKPQEDIGNIWYIESKDYSPKVETGMKLGFVVRVNPVVTRKGKRHDVIMDAKFKMRLAARQRDTEKTAQEIITETCGRWIVERAEKNGFKIITRGDDLILRADSYRQAEFYKTRDENPIRYSTVDISGALEVINEQSFANTLLAGLGPAKGFGCGLMLVRRI